jgi:hypothetical protein
LPAKYSSTWARWILIVAALVTGGSVALWPPLAFAKMGGSDFASRFSVVAFFSLLIERTVEIVMTVWRSEQASQLEDRVRRLVSAGIAANDPEMEKAQEALITFKAETLQWTIPVGFALGLLVAALGVRVLSQFVVMPENMLEDQRWWFNVGDIVFTGALLAGGADPIHKLLDLYRKLMESSASRAAGTTAKT